MITDFYNDVLQLFYQIINVGTVFWGFINVPISELLNELPNNFITSILEWITSAFSDLSILQFGLGSGLSLFIGITVLKFIKVV